MSEARVDRKQRSIEAVIERNVAIENMLTEALGFLRNMEGRLIESGHPAPEATGDIPIPTSHLPVLKEQQDRIEATCVEILSLINILEDNI